MSGMFVKAYCDKSKQYYGLKVEEVNGTPQVTDFYDIDTSTAKKLASTIDVPNLETAPNLRPCFGNGCGTRRVASCSCAKSKYNCQPSQGYRFQCLYCSNLHVYTKEDGPEEFDAGIIGTRIMLTQGQEVVISSTGANALEHLLVGVGWDIAITGNNMDVDSSVFMMSSRRETRELIYFGNLRHSSGCVVHMGDNLVGGKLNNNSDATDSENINVYLNKVPDEYDQLYFVLNIYSSESRNQDFGDVRNLYIRLSNAKTKQILAEYTVDKGMRSKTGMVIGKVHRKGDKWLFKAIGKSYKVSSVNDLEAYCNE